MTYNFENILCLKSTLQAVMCDYENNDNTKALQQFFDAATDITPVPSSTSFARIYEGKDSVLQFIRWFYATIPSAGIDDCTDALYEHLCDRMFSSETTIIDVPTIHSVLDAIDQLFPFFKIVTNNTPLSISIIDAKQVIATVNLLPSLTNTVFVEQSFSIECGMILMADLLLLQFSSTSWDTNSTSGQPANCTMFQRVSIFTSIASEPTTPICAKQI